jgi:hypothetical protein
MSAGPAAHAAVKVGSPLETGGPSVAVDAAGDAVIAWADTKDLAGANNFVQYCVLPVGATACTHSGSLVPADGSQYVDDVQVLIQDGAVTILADTFGAQNSATVTGADYEPVQAWRSTNGGQSFTILDGGLAVAAGPVGDDTQPVGGVVLPGTGELGFGFTTVAAAPTFHAFPAAAPPECSNHTCPAGYATLAPSTDPDQISNPAGNFVTNQNGVFGLFATNFTSGPLGCSNARTVPFGTAYVFGSGAQSPSNDYNISPGQPNTAWRVAVTHGDCNVDYPAVGGGPSGFGVLETDELNQRTVYHRFDPVSQAFDVPAVTVSTDPEQQPTVSQDGAGGVYATFLRGGAEGPISLSYSSDGGRNWTGPATLAPNTTTGVHHLTSAVNSAGQGWVSWDDNGSIVARPFQAGDAVVAAQVAHEATATSKSVTVKASCSAVPCTLHLSFTKRVAVHAHHSHKLDVTSVRSKKHRTVKLGSKTFKITSRGTKSLKVKLTKSGRHYLSGRHGTVSVSLAASEKAFGKTVTRKRTIAIKLHTSHK